MKRLLAFAIFLIIGIVLFSSVVRTVGWQEAWNTIQEFWGGKGLLIFILSLLMLSIGVVRWREILRHQGYSLPFFSLFKQYFGGFALSFFIYSNSRAAWFS